MPQRSKREQIIEAATRLFHADGFNATGIEKIKDSANVTKKTLYNHFRSKDELILAVLRREDENIRNTLMQRLDEKSKDPKVRLLEVFQMYADWIASNEFKGCMFIKAAAEFSDPENKCKVASNEAKRLIKQTIKHLAIEMGARDPDTLAAQLDLLIQGATVRAQVSEDRMAIRLAKDMAVDLIAKSQVS